MLILHKTVADDDLTKIIADDVNVTQNSCRRC